MNNLLRFFSSKSFPGILLCLATILALIAENSPLQEWYDMFKNIPVVFQAGSFIINKPLLLWINDGLMAIFFLLIGMEIKRELIEGHLSSLNQAILPFIAAIGGVLFPALIYIFININNTVEINGWAIPAATDIAFALGLIVALGDRIPPALKVCLAAIAIVDDLVAIIIIALFYASDISLSSLSLAGIGLLIVAFMNYKGVNKLGPYVMIGLFIWACVLKSGVHATLAGVALGLLIPLKPKITGAKSPLKIMEHALHPYVIFGVIPIFAFANAGISLEGVNFDTLMQPITLGITLGLFFGKQLGVMIFTFLAVKFNIAKLPKDSTWPQFYGMAVLTGVGFTMSLFIGTLAFTDVSFIAPVRLGVLFGSLLSAVLGVTILLMATKKNIQSTI